LRADSTAIRRATQDGFEGLSLRVEMMGALRVRPASLAPAAVHPRRTQGPGMRTPPDPDRFRRTPVQLFRRESGLSLRARVKVQTERDALVAELAELDAELLERSIRRRALIAELADLRDELYPVVDTFWGRRPPDLDVAPLPPIVEGADPLRGRRLRAACVAILRRHGTTSLRELHGLLHR
jgi:hypothetical protein